MARSSASCKLEEKKYIAANYKVDAEKVAPFIKKYLKAAVATGSLVQTKGKGASGSFKLASTSSSSSGSAKPSSAEKKKAGGTTKPKKTAAAAKRSAAGEKAKSVKKVTKAKKAESKTEKKPAKAKKVEKKSAPKTASSSSAVPTSAEAKVKTPTKAKKSSKGSSTKKPKAPKPKTAKAAASSPKAGKAAAPKKKEIAMYYSTGSDATDNYHRHGVAIVLDNRIAMSVIDYIPVSNRVIIVKLAGQPININLIQVYAPTSDKPEIEVLDFYKDITISTS
ncbi:uncharacterized protein [Diabrotica undecimpunctata]|uniref:uncharacterized protein n=1 Tax=Diabrotica undecimpunctata TaxID=50387 RepID=UPI003B633FD6